MIHQHGREAFDQISALGQETGFTMKPGRSLIQIVDAPCVQPKASSQMSLFTSTAR